MVGGWTESSNSIGGDQYWISWDLGAKYLGFFSSRSLKTREKYISFAQLVLLSLYIFEGSVFTFQFLNDKHTFLKKYTNCEKLTEQN